MKKLFLYPLRLLDSLADRVFAAAGALIFVQFPQFFSQYIQRLGGHLDEARRVVAEYTKAATANNLTLNEYIGIHLHSNNKVFISTGKLIQGFVERLHHLESSMAALKGASPWNRCLTFVKQMDIQIAKQTMADFTPGIPTTLEALVYALAGLILFFAFYQGVKGLIRFIARKIVPSGPVPRKPGLPA